MKAQTVTLRLTIRPSYSSAEHFKGEVAETLDWLTGDHDACTLEWLPDGEGEWPDPEDEDE